MADEERADVHRKDGAPKPQASPGAERPDGSPQPGGEARRQPARVQGESLETPENQPGRNPNQTPGKP